MRTTVRGSPLVSAYVLAWVHISSPTLGSIIGMIQMHPDRLS